MFTPLRRVGQLSLLAITAVVIAVLPFARAGATWARSGGSGAASASAGVASAGPGTVAASISAEVGAGWLGRQFVPGGYIPGANHQPDPASTVEAVLGLEAAGVGGTRVEAAMSWLEKNFESYVSVGGVDDPGRLATMILAATGAGVNVYHFGGHAVADNLVQRLRATQQMKGHDAGLFGTASPTYDGTYRESLSILALASVGRKNLIGLAWLKRQQCGNGGWTSYRSNPGVLCVAPDPATFSGPDTNSTSLAIQAIAATGARFPHSPVGFLERAQESNGGFGYIGISGHGQLADADSTALVIQALVALKDLNSPAFVRDGISPMKALGAFQLGCTAPAADRGAFGFQPVNGKLTANFLASTQAVPAAAGLAFPLRAKVLEHRLPSLRCG